ncbi:hypothetical protein llap_9952 [Limosa lapponica baueri]|uniref:Rna-directed dna polymerase from mobile element jockey-like n=1 Tax=Limosa lapponica baueri TaxID=1758121 RepID=A0A2I0U129_LIMLA|nr:hypothetical protein llap_9952 [Limosa lapponica baueri]
MLVCQALRWGRGSVPVWVGFDCQGFGGSLSNTQQRVSWEKSVSFTASQDVGGILSGERQVTTGDIQQRATKMTKELEHLSYEERLRDLEKGKMQVRNKHWWSVRSEKPVVTAVGASVVVRANTGRGIPAIHSSLGIIVLLGYCTSQKAKHILGCIKRSVASRSPGVLLWSPQYRKDKDLLEQVQRRATKMIRRLEHHCYEDSLRQLGLFSLEKRRLWGDLTASFQCLNQAYRGDGEGLLIRAYSDRTRGNSFKLKERRFRLDIRKKFFTLHVVRHWNRLPREVVDAPSLEVSKARLDGALSSLV